MLTEKDIFKSACGINNLGYPKSACMVQTLKLDINNPDNEPNIIGEMNIENAVVNICRMHERTMIDFTFPSHSDPVYRDLFYMLKNFTTVDNAVDSLDNIIPSILVQLSPVELEGEFYIIGIHADWCPIPNAFNDYTNTIRFIFNNNYLHTCLYDTDAIIKATSEIETEQEVSDEE